MGLRAWGWRLKVWGCGLRGLVAEGWGKMLRNILRKAIRNALLRSSKKCYGRLRNLEAECFLILFASTR